MKHHIIFKVILEDLLFGNIIFISFIIKLNYLNILYGENQIIAVGDSGLDMKHCFFMDLSYNITIGEYTDKHRKVVMYDPFIDEYENDVGGHGTHVCGSIAGIPENQDSEYKISFLNN